MNTYRVGLSRDGKVSMNTDIDADSAEAALRKYVWMYKFGDSEDYSAEAKTFRGHDIVVKEHIIEGRLVDA